MRPSVRPGFACPWCLSSLSVFERELRCTSCARNYAIDGPGRPDLRLDRPTRFVYRYAYDPSWGSFPWARLRSRFPAVEGRLDGAGLQATEAELLRAVPPAAPGAQALDLGCGRDHQRFREPLTRLGYSATGVDIDGTAADALADLHALPFPDETFDLLVTSAVFEHLKHPHLAMAEAARVCRDEALFVGAVAFGEPFHVSYFHHSPLALHELLQSSGFVADHYVASADWNAFVAHMEMGYAGARWPSWLRRLPAYLASMLALAPAWVRERLLRQHGRIAEDRLAFARSHAALVGFVARRRGTLRSRLVRPLSPADDMNDKTDIGWSVLRPNWRA